MRPGVASTFSPNDGIVQECSTSLEVTIIRMGLMLGRTKLLDTLIRRVFIELFMTEVALLFIRLEYSYVQCHWYPMVFTVTKGAINSSIMYRVFIDGSAINTKRKAGREVQNSSVSCDSNKYRFISFDASDMLIIMSVIVVMDAIRIIVWSWKKQRCSIKGEFLFCRLIFPHIGIILYRG